jgi:hypothetical protein
MTQDNLVSNNFSGPCCATLVIVQFCSHLQTSYNAVMKSASAAALLFATAVKKRKQIKIRIV